MRWQYENEISRCLLCHDPLCSKACSEGVDPAKRIRSLSFDDIYSAAESLDIDRCKNCSAPCQENCILNKQSDPIRIRELLEAAYEEGLKNELSDIEPDLSVDICGVKLENPFLLSSSVVASNYEMCAKAFEQGFAGACFKTICLFEQHETSPRFSALKSQNGSFYGFKNIEQLSDHSLEENLVVFGQLKEKYPDKIIIASIMGRNEKEWEYLARECDKAGADVIECNFSCPNMEESALGVTIGQSEELTKRFTAAARKGTKKPLLAKMTPNITDMVPVAIAAKEGGADGIAAINTIKSITSVNIDTLAPLPSVKGKSSPGGYSGSAVKPIALRFISDMSNCEDLQDMHISGMGGITTWRDALEFLLLGCGSLQITTAVMQYGYRIIDDLTAGLKGYMRERNIKDLYQLIGAAKENIVELDELERDTILYPKFRNEQCIGCGRCYISCYDGGHQAIRFDETNRRPILDAKKCVGCHLCLLVCPAKAITTAIRRVKKMTS